MDQVKAQHQPTRESDEIGDLGDNAARDLAAKAGDVRAVNVVLLGVLHNFLSVEEKVWTENLLRRFPPQTQKINLEAFQLGRSS